jgi:hypothetical protein
LQYEGIKVGKERSFHFLGPSSSPESGSVSVILKRPLRVDDVPACVRVQFSLAGALGAAMQREELNRYLHGFLGDLPISRLLPKWAAGGKKYDVWIRGRALGDARQP